jgi:hypothetical protein
MLVDIRQVMSMPGRQADKAENYLTHATRFAFHLKCNKTLYHSFSVGVAKQ